MSQQASWTKGVFFWALVLGALCASVLAKDKLNERGYPVRIRPNTLFKLQDPLAREQRVEHLRIAGSLAKDRVEMEAKRAGLSVGGMCNGTPYELMVYPDGWHFFQGGPPEFLKLLADAIDWILSPAGK